MRSLEEGKIFTEELLGDLHFKNFMIFLFSSTLWRYWCGLGRFWEHVAQWWSSLFVFLDNRFCNILCWAKEIQNFPVYKMCTFQIVSFRPTGEFERIRLCRGRVFALQNEPEVARVWLPNCDSPGLAMARALGDFCLKDFGLISVPEIFYRRLTDMDEFVVLATDGVRSLPIFIIMIFWVICEENYMISDSGERRLLSSPNLVHYVHGYVMGSFTSKHINYIKSWNENTFLKWSGDA